MAAVPFVRVPGTSDARQGKNLKQYLVGIKRLSAPGDQLPEHLSVFDCVMGQAYYTDDTWSQRLFFACLFFLSWSIVLVLRQTGREGDCTP